MKKYLSIALSLLFTPAVSFCQYWHLEGFLDEEPVTFEITKTYSDDPETEYNDSYYNVHLYYPNTHKERSLYGQDMENGNVLFADFNDKGDSILSMNGKLDASGFKGTFDTEESHYFNVNLKATEPFIPLTLLKEDSTYNFVKGKFATAGQTGFVYYLPVDKDLKAGLIRNATNNKTSDPQFHINDKNKEFFSSYIKDMEEFHEDGNDAMASFNYSSYEFIHPVLNNKNYLVMSENGYDYMGGAHGFSYEHYHTYSHKMKKWINSNDVFNMKYEKEIGMAIEDAIRSKHNIPADLPLSEGDNSIFIAEEAGFSDNFRLSKEGVTFYFGLYDLTPYVYGFYDILVPYSKLKPYLNPSFSY